MTITTTTIAADLRRLADWLDWHPEFWAGFGGYIKLQAPDIGVFRAGVDALAELGDPKIMYPKGVDLVQATVSLAGSFVTVTVFGARSRLCVEVTRSEIVEVSEWCLLDEVPA